MSEKRHRKHHSPEDKVRVVRLHLLEGVPVSDLCEEQGIHPAMYHRWQKQFFENGASAFASKKKGPGDALTKQVGALEDKLVRKNEVLSRAHGRAGPNKENLAKLEGRVGVA